MRRPARLALVGGLVVAAGAGALYWVAADDPEPTQWTTARRDDLVLSVKVNGTLQAVQTEVFGPPEMRNTWQFKIASMASEGEPIAAGAPLVTFDPSEIQQRREREVAERDAARTRIEKAEQEQSIRRQEATLRLAEAEARQRKAELKAEAPDELAAARELERVKLDLELAGKEVAYLRSKLESAARSAEASLGALRDQLERAEQAVARTGRDIRAMAVLAPREGTVIHVADGNDQKKKVGDTCWRGESVIELPDLSRMKALGLVDESDAGRVAPGQPVSLRLDAHPEVEFKGRVSSIWRTVQTENWHSPRKVMRIEIALDATDTQRMRPGMRFRGEIEIQRFPAVLAVDADAVFLHPEGPVAFRRTMFGHEAVPVQVGQRNERRVEILGGLHEGDEVALTDPTRLRGRV